MCIVSAHLLVVVRSKMEMINSIKMLVHIQLKMRDWLASFRTKGRPTSSSPARASPTASPTPASPKAAYNRKRSMTVNTSFSKPGSRRESSPRTRAPPLPSIGGSRKGSMEPSGMFLISCAALLRGLIPVIACFRCTKAPVA